MTKNEKADALSTIKGSLVKMSPEFVKVLPTNITVDRFISITMTAVQRSPDLLECSRISLFLAIRQCAEDGLVPDGRQAAIIKFNSKNGPQAQYMPMVTGLKIKLREADPKVASLSAEVVRVGDEFYFEKGDTPKIVHKPLLDGHDAIRQPTHVYTIVRYSDGREPDRHVMSWAEVLQVRDTYSKARFKKDGPWYTDASIGEMAKKTCFHRHCKTLDTTPEFQKVLERDNSMYDIDQPAEVTNGVTQPAKTMKTIANALESFAHADDEPVDEGRHIEVFNSLGAYVDQVATMIGEADTEDKIDYARTFWEKTAEARKLLKMPRKQEKTLATHINMLAVPDVEEEEVVEGEG